MVNLWCIALLQPTLSGTYQFTACDYLCSNIPIFFVQVHVSESFLIMWKHPASSFTTALLILPFIITSLTRMNHSNLLLSGPEIHYAAILNLVWHWCTPVKFNFGHVGLTLNNVSVTFLLSLQIILIISNCSERLWAEELLAKGGRFLKDWGWTRHKLIPWSVATVEMRKQCKLDWSNGVMAVPVLLPPGKSSLVPWSMLAFRSKMFRVSSKNLAPWNIYSPVVHAVFCCMVFSTVGCTT